MFCSCNFNGINCCDLTMQFEAMAEKAIAKQALKDLEEELNCSICLDIYTDPKILLCFHAYCRDCLRLLIHRNESGEVVITCPCCRQVTPVPDEGLSALRPAFHINRLVELRAQFMSSIHNAMDRATPEEVTDNHCSIHPGLELGLYCETCGELICFSCASRRGTHHEHEYNTIAAAFRQCKVEIGRSLGPLEEQVATVKTALEELDGRCAEIVLQLSSAEQTIEDTERVLQLQLIGRDKLKSLATQRDEVESIQAQVHSCLHFIRENLKPGKEEYVLRMKRNTLERMKVLTAPLQADKLKPIAEADIPLLAETCGLDRYSQAFLMNIEKHFQKCGFIDRYLAHLVFVGLPGSGKTTLIHHLLSLKEAEEMFMACSSTVHGVVSGIITVEVILSEDASSLHAVQVSEGCKWVKTGYRVSCFQQMNQEFATGEMNSGAHYNSRPSLTKEARIEEESHLQNQSLAIPVNMASIRKLLKDEDLSASLEGKTSLYISDFSGQFEFQESLPLMIDGRAIFVLCFLCILI